MSGQPKRRKMEEQLESLGGLPWLCGQIADGHSLRDIAAEHLDCSRWSVMRWLHADPDREAEYERSRRLGAASQVEQAQGNLTDAAQHAKEHANSAYVQAVRNDADFRKWYAGVVDRKGFGPPNQRTEVILNIGELHLAALQASGGPEHQTLPEAPTDVPRLEPGDPHEEDGP